MPEVRKERTGKRDSALNERHDQYNAWDEEFSRRHREFYGYDCPMSNLDGILVGSEITTSDSIYCEYNAFVPCAFLEYKNEHWQMPDNIKDTAWAKLLVNIAAPHKVPAYLAVYSNETWWYRCWPLNEWAETYFKAGKYLTEREYVALLYKMRRRQAPIEILNKLNAKSPVTVVEAQKPHRPPLFPNRLLPQT